MIKGKICSMAIYTLAMLIVVTNAFNLSPKYAHIFENPDGSLKNNYFGFTVALQRENTAIGTTSRLLVGAPRANSSLLAHASIVEPGVVFQCGVTSPSDACTPLVLDATGNERQIYEAERRYYPLTDRKDNAWIGGAMDVQDDDGGVVVCGSRWSNQLGADEFYFMNGICYWKNDTFASNSSAARKLPLIDGGFQKRYDYETEEDNLYYALGGAGISAHLTRDAKEMLIGAPGFFWLTGTVVRYSSEERSSVVNNRRRRDVISDHFKRAIVPNPYLNFESLDVQEYFGYSVDSGIFLKSSPNKTHYVGGAPRGADMKGLVLVFDFPKLSDQKMDILIELKGYQLGEYFGAALCVVDLNGDGLDDLLVGAPLHSVASSPGSRQHSGDEGRVYVYINEGNRVLREIGDTNQVTGSTDQGARFGTCIAKLGDLNMDGFNDIAVGAPYEGQGKGAIYIYHGRPSGINPKYSQRIAASAFPQAISGFGISISRGLDIDGNHYNDIAVGAYTSGHAVLIRSHPIISFLPRLYGDVEKIGIDDKGFTAIACLKYTGKHAPRTVEARITLHVSSYDGRTAFVSDSPLRTTKTVSYSDTVNGEHEICHNISVQIIKGIRQDYTQPIELRMDYLLLSQEENTTEHGDPDVTHIAFDDFCQTCPVVDPTALSFVTRTVPYATGCRDDAVCHTDLVVQATFQDLTPPFILGKEAKLRMKIAVKNTGESAFLVRVNVTFSSVTPLSRLPPECQEVTSQEVTSQLIQLECDVANPLSTDSEASFFLEVEMSGLVERTEPLQYTFSASSAGEEVNPGDNIQVLTLDLDSEADIYISGSSSQNQLVYSNKSHALVHTYEVRNDGPSPVSLILIEFQIPVAVNTSMGSITFLEVHEPTTAYISSKENQPFSCVTAGGYSFISNVQHGNTASTPSTMPTMPASNTEVDAGVIVIDKDQPTFNNTLFANCSNGAIRCMTVSCSVGPFLTSQTSAVIRWRMRANLTTLGPLLQKKDIKIASTGHVKIASLSVRQPMQDRPDNFTVETVFYGRVAGGSLSWWILALAIGGGLLLLCIIAGVFYKMGFFRRQKKEDLEKLKVNESFEGEFGVVNTEVEEMADNLPDDEQNKNLE